MHRTVATAIVAAAAALLPATPASAACSGPMTLALAPAGSVAHCHSTPTTVLVSGAVPLGAVELVVACNGGFTLVTNVSGTFAIPLPTGTGTCGIRMRALVTPTTAVGTVS